MAAAGARRRAPWRPRPWFESEAWYPVPSGSPPVGSAGVDRGVASIAGWRPLARAAIPMYQVLLGGQAGTSGGNSGGLSAVQPTKRGASRARGRKRAATLLAKESVMFATHWTAPQGGR